MQRRSLLLGLGLTLVGGLWLILPSFAPVHGNHDKNGHSSPAGTYLATLSVGTDKLLGITILNADGTWTSDDLSDFGGIKGLENKQSSFRGTWELVGKRTLKITGLCFSFDAKTGVPVVANRAFGTAEFSKGFETATGVISQRFYIPLLQDPLDQTDGKPYPSPLDAVGVSLRRLEINK